MFYMENIVQKIRISGNSVHKIRRFCGQGAESDGMAIK